MATPMFNRGLAAERVSEDFGRGLSRGARITVAGLVLAAAGMVLQLAAGSTLYPSVTGPVVLLGTAAIVAHPRPELVPLIMRKRSGFTRRDGSARQRVPLRRGPSMATLMKVAVRRRDAPPYLGRALSAVAPDDARPASAQALVEPLSEGELDVLRLLQCDLDGPEIARELAVSLNALRTARRISTSSA